MRELLCIAVLLAASFTGFTQVGINTTTPHASAVLDIESTTLGFLPPRMDAAQRNLINTPAVGLTIYNTDDKCLNLYNGAAWLNICSAPTASIATIDCSGATNAGTLTNGVGASAVSSTLSYTGGDAGAHSGQTLSSTGVTGLTATLSAGTFATGAGSLVYNITGTPSAVGTASFAINIGGQTCTLTRTVAASGPPTVVVNTVGGTTLTFMAHNLGADTSFDANTPVKEIHGNIYQWGRIAIVANADTPVGAITGWNTSSAADSSWLDASKTVNDPCPAGFRVPSSVQWNSVINNHVPTTTGPFLNGDFTSAKHYGTGANQLTLPIIGYRDGSGALYSRGDDGSYWTSTGLGGSSQAYYLYVAISSSVVSNYVRPFGFAVRCVEGL